MNNQINKNELLVTLLHLKGIFAPNSFTFFEENHERRSLLIAGLREPLQQMFEISSNSSRPDIPLQDVNLEILSFEQCATYMIFYLRLAFSQSGGSSFIKLWKDGTAEKLVMRMLDTFDKDKNNAM